MEADLFYLLPPVTPLRRIIKLLLNALLKFRNLLKKDVTSFIRNVIILSVITLRRRNISIKNATILPLLLFINLFIRIVKLLLLRIKRKNLKIRINRKIKYLR